VIILCECGNDCALLAESTWKDRGKPYKLQVQNSASWLTSQSAAELTCLDLFLMTLVESLVSIWNTRKPLGTNLHCKTASGDSSAN